jgi:phosphatidylglycerol:prolipoprotein diacylglycerol transferase
MWPYLFKIPLPFTDLFLPMHSYGSLLAIGFFLGILLFAREVKQNNIDQNHAFNLSYWVIFSAVIGARLFHCGVNWKDYIGAPWRVLYVWEGGLVYYGGLLAALVASAFYLKKHKLNFRLLADLAAPSVALGLFFGRTGCLLVGCCHGKFCPVDYPFAITFPSDTIGLSGVPLFPTQIASMLANLAIFAILFFWVRKRKTFDGQVFGVFIILYSIARSIIELWRADPRGFVTLFHIPGPAEATEGLFSKLVFFETLALTESGNFAVRVSESQFVSLFMVLFVVGLMIRWRTQSQKHLL